MKIVCDSCGAKYSIADEKVAGKIFKIRCKKCSSVLEVRGDQTGAHPFADTAASGDESNEATWYIVVDGEQKGPLPPIELSRLFAKGSVGLDSYVWKEGFGDWKAASDVPELKQIFGGAAASTGESNEDTSSFGTEGDLFSGGREPTSEIDTESSMVTGFDDASTPTTTEAEDAPLAAAAAAEVSETATTLTGDASPGLGGGGMAAASAERMTGQRNENSVLFSLSNLQQLASQGGAQPQAAQPAQPIQPTAASTASAPQAAGEGSGLIDIRALAQSTSSTKQAAPAQAVDDLLAIGTGTSSTIGSPLLGPAPLETSDNKRWIWIAGAAVVLIAIVGAGIGVGMALGGSEDDALEIAAPMDPRPATPQQAAAATAEPDAAPEPEEPVQEAAVVDIEPEEPAAAATIEEPAAPAKRQRTAPKKKRQRTQRSSTQQRAKAEPTPKRKSNNLDALMDEVVGGSSPSKPKAKQASTSGSSGAGLPDSPSRNDVKKALQGVSGAVKSCKKDAGGTAIVDVVFSGKTGRVSNAKVSSGPFKGTPVGACVASAVKRARVPRFKQASFKVTFPYRL
jgi:predicted Zn finger-like uncharacterized protein